ncbi:MAG: hypothetical protein J5910_09760 [Lachnospiraceae bacterium]|nr:hypothetical protein [Lachnospiraceae bacterium]
MIKKNKILPSILLILALVIPNPACIMAETDTAQTASKTVRISTGEEAEEEKAEETEAGREEKKADKENTEDAEDAGTPVIQRMDVTEMTEITIADYDQWCDFARKCSYDTWSEDKYVRLTDNIDFNMKDFMPVPYFAGVFDGEGHTLNRAAFTDEENYTGVFSKTAPTAVIRSVNVIGVMKPAGKSNDVGGIVGDNYGMIADCKYDGYVEGNEYVGGIAGYNEGYGVISGCFVKGKITGLHHVGGICGANEGLVTGCETLADINTVTVDTQTGLADIKVEEVFTSLLNKGKEEGNKMSIQSSNNPVDIGGIAGHNIGEISSCMNGSTVGYEHVGYNIGGIAGRQSGYIHDCTNTGRLHGRKDVGGIVGQAEPYVRLDLSSDVITQISTAIGKLHDSVDKTIRDTDASSGVVSARLNVIRDFANRALSDTGYLANSTQDYVNQVVGTTNEVANRIQYVLEESSKSGGPMDDVASAGDDLKKAAQDVSELAEDLDIYNYLDEGETVKYDNAKKAIKDATDEFEGYYDKYSDSEEEEIRKKREDVYNTTYYATRQLYIEKKYKSGEWSTDKYDDLTDAQKAEADSVADGDAKDAVNLWALEEAGSEYESKHPGEPYAETLAKNTKIIADIIYAHAGEMEEDAKDDGKDAAKNLKRMAGDLKDAGSSMKSIIKTVADKGSVNFPQLSDEYRLHTNSLVMNIQGMSDNMGLLNSEMKGSTDAVCADLEGVNDEFSSLMLLFTDAMDGALDMDYSQVFEDESNDVCEDSVDATIANCENRGRIYADINTGGIAGTMAQEYDFDLEGDITGVKNAAKKSTYRTKCVLRDNKNYGEVRGKKSYVGGACGLHEIGTILRNSNFAKASSESSDYVGGIAGRSYSTIRNCYEKGVLAGDSYVGGIAGECVDIFDCVAMPAITKQEKFSGAVTGFADSDGKLKRNVFVSDSLAGIDRISKEGQAEPISYGQLLAMENIPGEYSQMKVSFVVDGKEVASINKKIGEVVMPDETPIETEIKAAGADDKQDDDKVKLEDDQYIEWECSEEIPVYEDMEIEGEIARYASVLAGESVRDNKQSIFLVEGRFTENDKLSVTREPAAGEDEECYLLSFTGGGESIHYIRYQMPAEAEKVRIFVSTEDSPAYEEAECDTFGRYIRFPVQSDHFKVKITMESEDNGKRFMIICASFAFILVAVVVMTVVLIKKRKRRRAEKRAENKEENKPENKPEK